VQAVQDLETLCREHLAVRIAARAARDPSLQKALRHVVDVLLRRPTPQLPDPVTT
jgi:hypothetical protein